MLHTVFVIIFVHYKLYHQPLHPPPLDGAGAGAVTPSTTTPPARQRQVFANEVRSNGPILTTYLYVFQNVIYIQQSPRRK